METTIEQVWWRPIVAGALTVLLFAATMLFAVKTFSVEHGAGPVSCGGAFSSVYSSANVPAPLQVCKGAAETRRVLAYIGGTLTVLAGITAGAALVTARRRHRDGSRAERAVEVDLRPFDLRGLENSESEQSDRWVAAPVSEPVEVHIAPATVSFGGRLPGSEGTPGPRTG